MVAQVPPELVFLQDQQPSSQEQGWASFLTKYSRLLIRAARTFGGDYDAWMDRYRFVVEALRQDDFRRLRSYVAVEHSSLTAWLVVVARRLCLDYERHRFGRERPTSNPGLQQKERRFRRQLAGLAAPEVSAEELPAPGEATPERVVREAELHAALEAALDRLDSRDRLMLKLRFEDELSVKEIADLLGFRSVFDVYRRLKSALGETRRHLQTAGVHDPVP